MTRIIYVLIFSFWILNGNAWNAAGHKVVAQIAYDNLSPKAKIMCHKFLPSSFIDSAIWMDVIRTRDIYWYDGMHYIDIPFSRDGSTLPPVASINAVWAIKNAIRVLSSKKTNKSDKQLALLMLIHIVGDIHQPLHAVTKVSISLPKGDLGGNLFFLGSNSVGNNLHQYWDNGAGYFQGQFSAKQVRNKARQLEKKWPCASTSSEISPKRWAKMSHKQALNAVYQLNPNEIPSPKYQKKAQFLVQKQVAFAGCRLAALLNKMAR